ncbi:MAG: DUF721 domain-containing protein [Pararhodobacter sp.]
MRGFEPAVGLLREPIRKAGESRGFAATRLLTHWAEIVGAELAALCRPVKVGYGRGGLGATLTVLASGAAAPLVQMQLPRLKERVNACYGYAAIAHIQLTQTAPQGFAEAATPFSAAGAAAGGNIAPPSPQALARARQVAGGLTEGVGDHDLKAALERLAENVLSRHKGPGTEPPDAE